MKNVLKLSLPFLLAVLLAGCAVTLVSSYDATTDQEVTALQKSVAALLNELDQNPVPAFAVTKAQYDSIFIDLHSLYIRNEARPENTLTVRQLDALKAELTTLEKEHQQNELNEAMLGPARESLDQTFRAILKLELEKKELNRTE